MVDVDTHIENLNEIITELRNVGQYNAHRDEMNILLHLFSFQTLILKLDL
jgi:hypothetical protein